MVKSHRPGVARERSLTSVIADDERGAHLSLVQSAPPSSPEPVTGDTSRSRRPGLFDQAPFLVFWETTRACDLACQHCRACAVPKRDPRELSTVEGKALLDEIAAMGTPLVVLTGGDPAKREDLVELVAHGASRGLRMALTPSATPLVTREWLFELKAAGLSRLAISLDASTAEAHDRFRGVSGSYARTLEILADAREIGLTTQINTSISRFDREELERMAALCARAGIELWSIFVVVPTGRAKGQGGMSAEEVESLLEWLAELSEHAPFDVKTTAAPQFRRVLLTRKHKREDVVGIRDGIGRSPRGVNDGQGVAFVSHVGEVHPSGFLPIPCGNVRLEGLTRIYRESLLFRTLRDSEQLHGKCGECEFRKVCGGSRARASAVSGDVLGEDPACVYQPGSLARSRV